MLLVALAYPLQAAILKDIQVNNGKDEARIYLQFEERPTYAYFSLQNPNRVVLDVRQIDRVPSGLPLRFSHANLIKEIRTSEPKEPGTLRLVFDLQSSAQARASTQQQQNRFTLVFTIKAHQSTLSQQASISEIKPGVRTANNVRQENDKRTTESQRKNTSQTPFRSEPSRVVMERKPQSQSSREAVAVSGKSQSHSPAGRIMVAIDAGHGGQDPGAIGPGGLKEKQVTLAIARRLKALMAQDPRFTPVLTRTGDYFISVMGRSDVARSKKANLLISIHADAAPNRSATGASVWVLSNRRADSELGRWLEQHEKQSELLGGAGDLLSSREMDPYLSKAVLDLQFGNSQRVGYDVAKQILRQIRRVSSSHKPSPEHASLGVLRSPDIPSLLVETGFISNYGEERLLASVSHQEKIAQAIYQGVRNYFQANPIQPERPAGKKPAPVPIRSQIANQSPQAQPVKYQLTGSAKRRYTVKRGDTLSGIAARHGISLTELKRVNKLKADTAILGTTLIIP